MISLHLIPACRNISPSAGRFIFQPGVCSLLKELIPVWCVAAATDIIMIDQETWARGANYLIIRRPHMPFLTMNAVSIAHL
jgi:hypothetical protein